MAKIAEMKRAFADLVAENDALEYENRQLKAALEEAWKAAEAAPTTSAGTGVTAKNRGKGTQAGLAGA